MDKIQYHEHEIELTEDYRFRVSGSLFATESVSRRTFDSLLDAKGAVMHRLDEAAKEKAQNIKLNARLLSSDGMQTYNVTRISRTTGDMIGVGEREREVYPVIPWIRDLIRRRIALANEIIKIEAELKPFAINMARYYSRIEIEAYPNIVAKLEKEVNEKYEAAHKVANPEVSNA